MTIKVLPPILSKIDVRSKARVNPQARIAENIIEHVGVSFNYEGLGKQTGIYYGYIPPYPPIVICVLIYPLQLHF